MLVTNLPFDVSPKLVYTLVSLLVSYVLTHYAITLDPDLALLLSTAVASCVGYKAPTGTVLPGDVGPGSDVGLSTEAAAELNKT